MRPLNWAASLLLAASVISPAFAAPKPRPATASPTAVKSKYTWDECFRASIERGFDHEYEEWQQFLADCMAGLIPMPPRKMP